MPRCRIIALTGALAAVAAGAAQGQTSSAGPVTVAPLVGYMKWDKGAALDDSPFAGLSATYQLAGGFAFGAFVEGGRPTTLGRYFPAALFKTGSSTQLFVVSQRVTVLNFGGRAQYGFNLGGANAYLGAGLGRYTVFPDAQQENGVATFSGLSYEVGAGVGISLGEGSGLRFDVRNVRFTDYTRAKLNPVNASAQNTLFPDVQDFPLNVPRPECSTEACSMSNWRLGVSFVFYPQRAAR